MPYDFISSANNTTTSPGNPWNTTQVANGSHTITQAVTRSAGGSEVDTATFTVQNVTLSLSPTSLAFGSQVVGTTSAAKTVTLSNSGTAPVTFTGVTITGDYAVSKNTCGALTTKGATRTISVTFTPATTGSRAGTLTITDNANTSPQRVSLSGAGAAAANLVSLAVTPTNPSISLGTKQQFTATGTLSNGSKQDVTTAVSWSSSATGVATISNASGSQGLASSVATGSTTIMAASGSIIGSTTLTVQAAQPTITFSANPRTIPKANPVP